MIDGKHYHFTLTSLFHFTVKTKNPNTEQVKHTCLELDSSAKPENHRPSRHHMATVHQWTSKTVFKGGFRLHQKMPGR